MLFHWALLATASISINMDWFSFMFNVLFETSFKRVHAMQLQFEMHVVRWFEWGVFGLLPCKRLQIQYSPLVKQVSKIHQSKRVFRGSSVWDGGCYVIATDLYRFDTFDVFSHFKGVVNTVIVE